MTIAILCADIGDVDIIENVPDMTNSEDIEEYLTAELNYNLDNCQWQEVSGKINYLTPKDFG